MEVEEIQVRVVGYGSGGSRCWIREERRGDGAGRVADRDGIAWVMGVCGWFWWDCCCY